MIRRKLRLFLGVLIALFVLGCQEGIRITVKDLGDRALAFILEPLSVLGWDGVEITAFAVTEHYSDGRVKDVVWRVESRDVAPRRVHEIRYGTVPDGFREVHASKPLVPGQTYVAEAGMPGKVGVVSFVAR